MTEMERLLRFPPGQRVRITQRDRPVSTGTIVELGAIYIYVKVDSTKPRMALTGYYTSTELEPINDGE